MALGSTQPPTEMSTRNISCGVKAAGVYGWQLYHFHAPILWKSGILSLLEPSGPAQACNGITLPFYRFPRISGRGREAGRSTISAFEIKIKWSHTSSFLYVFTTCIGTNLLLYNVIYLRVLEAVEDDLFLCRKCYCRKFKLY